MARYSRELQSRPRPTIASGTSCSTAQYDTDNDFPTAAVEKFLQLKFKVQMNHRGSRTKYGQLH